MKLYCFLLLIILICLVYDNKLYEGANGQYDTSKDATVGYQSGGLKGEEVLDQLGVKDTYLKTPQIPMVLQMYLD